jgi:hypothetical protein
VRRVWSFPFGGVRADAFGVTGDRSPAGTSSTSLWRLVNAKINRPASIDFMG